MRKYDIWNPTKARRVIYDGIPVATGNTEQQTRIEIAPDETKLGIPIADHIAAEFSNDRRDTRDLVLTPCRDQDEGLPTAEDVRGILKVPTVDEVSAVVGEPPKRRGRPPKAKTVEAA